MSYRSVLITGASSGIGAALAQSLGAQGATVTLAARREAALKEQASAIEAGGGRAHIEVLDVSDAEATEARVAELDAERHFDLVIANAGVGGSRWGGKLRWEDCKSIIAVNVSGAVATLTGALPGMVARGEGHLVGISSVAGVRGMPSSAAYCASKAFLSTFLESLRIDLHSTGVSVTDVRPGFVDTPMTEGMTSKSKPFEVERDRAAQIILEALERKRPVCTFPAPMALVHGLLAAMPRVIYEPTMRRARKS